MSEIDLKSAQFRKERESSWSELERLVALAEHQGLRNLSHEDLQRLPTLYRGAVSSLSVARAISLDQNALDYLTNLTSRAYVAVYATKRPPARAVAEFASRVLPRATRKFAVYLAVACLLLALGVLCGYLMTLADVERYYSFVPGALAEGRDPTASTEQLREVLYRREEGEEVLHGFATFLFTHNAKIGILCFALGFAAGVPVVFLLFQNGLILGAMAALYSTRGLEAEFWAWVLPHGVTELLAVCVCGAAGLVLGMAVVFPGEFGRMQNLGRRGREAALLVLGAVVLFFFAALIEGFFRQLVQSVPIRWAVAASSALLWALYFGLAGRRGTE